jgi:hypothetical protein
MESASKNKTKKTESYLSVFDKITHDNGIVFAMKANEK